MTLSEFLKVADRGAAAALAKAVGVHAVVVSDWRNDVKPVPHERCPAIERATGGAVRCEDLRPDAMWHRVADVDWPWHPEGRPTLDLALPLRRVRAGGHEQKAPDMFAKVGDTQALLPAGTSSVQGMPL